MLLAFLAGVLAWLPACSSEAERGEVCEEAGAQEGECTEGNVCGKETDTSELKCLQVCTDQAQCPTGLECNGVEGSSVKACRLKSGQ
jgi:hypothetical protein